MLETGGTGTEFLYIAGTYAENPYFSGNDILVSMEEYHKIYENFSVTDDDFYFERMAVFVR